MGPLSSASRRRLKGRRQARMPHKAARSFIIRLRRVKRHEQLMPRMKNYLYLLVLPIAMGAQSLPTLVDEALLHNREVLAAQKKY